jgi:type IX secretion system PorP/SprF family membrane protein
MQWLLSHSYLLFAFILCRLKSRYRAEMLSRFHIILVLSIACLPSFAQDPQFSQYYNAPLYLNPAFAGTGQHTRAGMNFRTQWTSISVPYQTYSVFVDHNFEPKKTGLGFMLMRDRQGTQNLSYTGATAFYSYQVNINDRLTFRPGLSAGIAIRDANYNNYTFGDQLTNNGNTGAGSVDAYAGLKNKIAYPDFGTGGLLYSKKFWIGISASHINRPSQSFNHSGYHLPIKASMHGGYKFYLDPTNKSGLNDRSIIPSFNFRSQGKYQQLDLGVNVTYDPVMFGLWYRGIPFKHYLPGFNNNEAIVLMLGMHYNKLSVGYSYDFNISKLAPAGGGTHELSLVYEWAYPYRKRIGRPLPCPKFYNVR